MPVSKDGPPFLFSTGSRRWLELGCSSHPVADLACSVLVRSRLVPLLLHVSGSFLALVVGGLRHGVCVVHNVGSSSCAHRGGAPLRVHDVEFAQMLVARALRRPGFLARPLPPCPPTPSVSPDSLDVLSLPLPPSLRHSVRLPGLLVFLSSPPSASLLFPKGALGLDLDSPCDGVWCFYGEEGFCLPWTRRV